MRAVKPLWSLLALGAVACSGSRGDYPVVTPPGASTDPVAIGVVTGAAVTIYAVGGGCKIADCPADTVCNFATERCERIECGDTLATANDPCPPSSQCSPRTGTCVPF